MSDEVRIDGKVINKQDSVVYLLNKPKNVISSVSDDRGRRCVVDLIDSEYRIFPIGRLDYDTSGLLLLTNDGDLMNRIIHPKYEVDKTYEVTVDGLINDKDILKLESGVNVDDYISAPCKVNLIKQDKNKYTSFLTITIHEGKNRQVRKMFMAVGYKVMKLHRIKVANIELGNLKTGEYRKLKPFELKVLNKYLDGK